ncbi:MAG: HPt (histidine-containing phosphotransfer) domain-containing protein [Flavobacteriales bacterium]|jgi:hypothetical protein
MINLDNLKNLSKHNHAFIREILEVYLMNTPKDVDSMREFVEIGDFKMVHYYAHKLKSSSFTIGFIEGFRIFQKIELCVKDEQKIPGLFKEAQVLCDSCIKEVKIELTNYT